MPEVTSASQPSSDMPVLEVISPGGARAIVSLTKTHFYLGRGEADNDLQLPDRRISRQCAAIVSKGNGYEIEDRGHRLGLFVNGQRILKRSLADGDVISFGLDDSYQVVFHDKPGEASIKKILDRMGGISENDIGDEVGFGKLNLLLEATMLLHSALPLDSVLNAMLDQAIKITNAERGLLIEAGEQGALRNRLARKAGGESLALESIIPSQTALRLSMERQTGIITEDTNQADAMLQVAQSIISQRLRVIVAIPLYAMTRASSESPIASDRFLGILYLDSRRPAAFTSIDRQILDAIAVESASILDNARLVERERERQRIEQELSIARNIQQALLPRGFRDFPHITVTGRNIPCHACGGDYFDIFPMKGARTAFLIADVSGKGLGAALVTTMLQGALSGMTMGADPADVLQHVNNFLCQHADLRRYATLFFGIVDAKGLVEYFNAGHPSPLVLRRGNVRELFTEGSLPLGLLPEATYKSYQVALEDHDTLILYSDGVTEATSPTHEMFEVSRLQEILSGHHEMPLDKLQERIVTSVEEFARGADQTDDITVLLVRYNSSVQQG